ncbi:MAG: helix-turn-helix transcriptional regulator [Synechococcales cyanobacterium CRU_2_2]|nr:helix-turn-helix transcriptional regulator [Synechococcales cyanobacterium CRU_2_2]
MNSKIGLNGRGAAIPGLQSEHPGASQRLRSHLQSLGIGSFRALAQQAGVSEWQVRQLRRGKVGQMRLESLKKLSQVLQLQLESLVRSPTPVTRSHRPEPLRLHPAQSLFNKNMSAYNGSSPSSARRSCLNFSGRVCTP